MCEHCEDAGEFNAGSAFDDLEDEDFWNQPTEGAGLYERAQAADAAGETKQAPAGVFKERCANCAGTGTWRGGYSRFGRECFACKGKGFKTFRTSPDQRAKGRASAQKARVNRQDKIAADRMAWIEAHKAEYEWLRESANRARPFELAVDLLEKLRQYGSFSEKQDAMITRLTQQSAEKKAAWAAEKAEAAKNAPTVDIRKIEEAFANARERGLKKLMLRLGDYKFAPDRRDPGLIWVNHKDRDGWMARIKDGKLFKSYACTPAQAEEITMLAADPATAAVAYGKQTSNCAVCGKFLENPESVARGIGPICWGKYFG